MKKSVITIGSVVILILSAIVFVFVPAMAGSSGAEGNILEVGKYKGQKIELVQGSLFHSILAHSMEHDHDGHDHTDKNQELYENYQKFSDAFNQTVFTMAVSDAVNETGYKVPSSLINQEIVEAFTPAGGKFDRAAYRTASKSQKQSLRSSIIQQEIRTVFIRDYFGGKPLGDLQKGGQQLYGIKVPQAEVDFIAEMGADEKEFSFVSYDINSVPEEVKADFEMKNSDLFTKFSMSVLSYETQKDAEAARARIEKGEITFDDSVEGSKQYYSADDGKLASNYTYRYQIANIVKEPGNLSALEQLPQGAMSAVIATASGFSIFRADAAPAKADFSDEATSALVENYIKNMERSLIETYYMNKAKEFAAEYKNNLGQGGTAFTTMESFPINYSNLGIMKAIPESAFPELSGASMSENFLKAVAGLKEGEISEPIVLSNSIILLKMEKPVRNEPEDKAAREDEIRDWANYFNQSTVESKILRSPDVENNVGSAFSAFYAGSL